MLVPRENFHLVLFGFVITIGAIACTTVQEHSPTMAAPIAHHQWDSILKLWVNESGEVDYQSLSENRSGLDAYITLLESAHPNESWTIDDRKTYWINAYNAYVVQLVLDHWPIKSVKEISGPWNKGVATIEGQTYNLKTIENDFLRAKYNDPRIHFALVCASKSCPRLRNEAYSAEGLHEQLHEAAVSFINDTLKNQITDNSMALSRIFKWYEKDFTDSGTLAEYLSEYSHRKINLTGTIAFNSYDWSLNQ